MTNAAFAHWILQARRFLARLCSSLGAWLARGIETGRSPFVDANLGNAPSAPPLALYPIEHVILTDAVVQTLFKQFAAHRRTDRGEEETGWVLMGWREERMAVVTAALPAGAGREAGVAHVRFDVNTQALSSRILRQTDRRLTIVGIVHTHPGSLRHPSRGDYEGDRLWVRLLRGREGVFGIGTADGAHDEAWSQPKTHMMLQGGLRLTWYALGEHDRNYRPLAVEVVPGDDLAAPLQPIWPIIEKHAEPLEALCQQLARLRFFIDAKEASLWLVIPTAYEAQLGVKLLQQAIAFRRARGEWQQPLFPDDPAWRPLEVQAQRIDQGIFAALAEQAQHEGHL